LFHTGSFEEMGLIACSTAPHVTRVEQSWFLLSAIVAQLLFVQVHLATHTVSGRYFRILTESNEVSGRVSSTAELAVITGERLLRCD